MTKSLFVAWALCAATLSALAADVGVSVQVSQPGIYGRIDIGRFPQPQVVVAQPVLVRAAPQAAPPAYLWVPPGHRKNWRKHCHRYQACGTPVYFVQEGWYQQHVMAGQAQPPQQSPGPGRGHGRDKDRGHGHSKKHGDDHGGGQGKHGGKHQGKHHDKGN